MDVHPDRQTNTGDFRGIFHLSLACFFVFLLGCGSESTRRPISGAVTVDGKAVERGSISFFPDQGHVGPAASTSIRAGNYQFSASNGPTAGPHRVVIGMEPDDGPAENAVVDLPAQSAGVKLSPEEMAASSRKDEEPNRAKASQTQWTIFATVPASDSPANDQPIDFALTRETNADEPARSEGKQ